MKLSKGGLMMKPILILTTGDVALPALRDYFGKIEPFDTYVNDLPNNYSDDKDELEKVLYCTETYYDLCLDPFRANLNIPNIEKRRRLPYVIVRILDDNPSPQSIDKILLKTFR